MNDLDSKIADAKDAVRKHCAASGLQSSDLSVGKICEIAVTAVLDKYLNSHALKPVSTRANTHITDIPANALIIYADGGCRGNPGPASGAAVLMNAKTMEIIDRSGIFLAHGTSNVAEYYGLHHAFHLAIKHGIARPVIRMDSKLIVNQMSGAFKCKNAALYALRKEALALHAQFENVSLTHIPRELNEIADAYANEILDENMGVALS